MNTLPDAEERMVRDQARTFLESACPASLVRVCEKERSHSTTLWSEMIRLGWLETGLPESVGGLGLPVQYLALLFQEAGRFLAPVPLASVMVPALILARHGGPQHAALLDQVRAGTSLVTWAIQEADGRWTPDAIRTTARRDGDSLVLNGTKTFVDNFALSGQCLVACRMGDVPAGRSGLTLVLVDTGAANVSRTDLVATAKDSHAAVRLGDVRVPLANVIGEPGNADALIVEAMDLAALFCTAQLAGAARRATELAIAYANQRVAFEQPIGSFQSIQHLCADMVMGIDGVELLLHEAAWKMGAGRAAGVQVSQAKAFANEKCVMACRSAQQIHGGMGFMMEFDLQLWYRRVVSWSLRCGTTQEHRRRVADWLLSQEARIRLDGRSA